jgi:hypothetical protein
MKFRTLVQALSGSGKKSTERRRLDDSENGDSPLVPKRLVTPAGGLTAGGTSFRSGRPTLTDVTASGTVRAIRRPRQQPRLRTTRGHQPSRAGQRRRPTAGPVGRGTWSPAQLLVSCGICTGTQQLHGCII